MNLIDVDVIGSKPAQGVLDLAQDTGAAGIAEYLSALPFQSGLGCNKNLRAQSAFGDRLADDLLRTAESVDRGRVDNVDTMLECGADRSNGLSFVGSAPHPTADGPSSDSNRRHLQRRAGNVGKLHVHLESFCLTSHDPIPCFGTCVWERE